jgi:predicted GNAT family acetyltransferase
VIESPLETLMSFQITHEAGAGRFTTQVDGHLAELVYRQDGHHLSIDHTGVPDAIGGRGIAGALVKAALDYARGEGLRVIPACSYSAAYIRQHPEYADLVD